MSRDFVRLGKWFVQPFDGPDRSFQKASHLSFAFHYFVHGESCVCASVDVRQHPAVRRLAPNHISAARTASVAVPVILAPYGLAATLTGVTYKDSDEQCVNLLSDWSKYYPLDFILFAMILFFMFITCIYGLVRLGIKFLCFNVSFCTNLCLALFN